MAKQTWVNANGAWKKVKSAWVNVNGIWKKDVMPKGVVSGGYKEFMSYYLPQYRIRHGGGPLLLLNENFVEVASGIQDGQKSVWSEVDDEYGLYVLPYLSSNISPQTMYKLDADMGTIYKISRNNISSTYNGNALSNTYWYFDAVNQSWITLFSADSGEVVKSILQGIKGQSLDRFTLVVDNNDNIFCACEENGYYRLKKVTTDNAVLRNLRLDQHYSYMNYLKLHGGNDRIFVTYTNISSSSSPKVELLMYDKNLTLKDLIQIDGVNNQYDRIKDVVCGKEIICIAISHYAGSSLQSERLIAYDYDLNKLWTINNVNLRNEVVLGIDKQDNIYYLFQNGDVKFSIVRKYNKGGALIRNQNLTSQYGQLSQFNVVPNILAFPTFWN